MRVWLQLRAISVVLCCDVCVRLIACCCVCVCEVLFFLCLTCVQTFPATLYKLVSCCMHTQAYLAYNKGQGPLSNASSVRMHLWCDGWLAETKQARMCVCVCVRAV
jgi:hypothetical protein